MMYGNSEHRRGAHDSESDRALVELFAHAKPRTSPPEADERSIRAAVFEEWDALTGRRVFLRRIGAFAAAATVVFGLVAVWPEAPDGDLLVDPVVAHVERIQGAVTLAGSTIEAVPLGMELRTGAQVVTGQGQVALRLADGGSLRLAPNTHLRIVSSREAELVAGTVYYDSEKTEFSEPSILLNTPLGSVRDIGTQFIAGLESDALEIVVREGRVDVTRDDERVNAQSGERLISKRDVAEISREAASRIGDEWAWAEALAPPFAIEGRDVGEFLTWVGRQTGRRIQYASLGVERYAQETILRGSVDFAPLQKLAAVLATTDMAYAVEDEVILVSLRQ